MDNLPDIKRWMKIAKRHGAIFENVDFEMNSDGVRAVAIDKNRDFIIKVVKPVLIPREAIEITENAHYVLDSFVKDREVKDMLNEYLNFILSEERIEKFTQLFREFNALPDKLQRLLRTFGVSKFFDNDMNIIEIKERLISSRTIRIKSKPHFMPFIDFLNHNFRDGVNYKFFSDSVVIKGRPSESGEIFARYNLGDSFAFLHNYYFPDNSIFAYSGKFAIVIDSKKSLTIQKKIFKLEGRCNGLRLPKFTVKGDSINLDALWLGSSNTPRKPFWSFKKFWEEEVGRDDTIEVYSKIKSLNITGLVDILEELDKIEQNMATDMIKKATINQLKVIGSSFEDVDNIPC